MRRKLISFVTTQIILFTLSLDAVKINDTSMGMKFLNQFGYLTDSQMAMKDGEEKSEAMESAIMMYQEYNHIEPTGKMDQKTTSMMESPRCGNSDRSVVEQMLHSGRKKRYSVQAGWEKSVITYRFKNYANCCLPEAQIEEEFALAIKLWMSVISPTFKLIKEENDAKTADIDVVFVKGPHHDNMSFAEMNTLAHAFYPQQTGNHPLRGDIHFNDEVNWTSGEDRSGQTFLQTACHELGHSLGLEHSMIQKAVMFTHVEQYIPNFELHLDDVNGIQSLYGTSDTQGAGTVSGEPDLETAGSGTVINVLPPPVHGNSPAPKNDGASTEVRNDALTRSNSIFPNFVLPGGSNLKKEPRILPKISTVPDVQEPHSSNAGVTASKNNEAEYSNVVDQDLTNLETETWCRDYLSSRLIHSSKISFSCLKFLWMQFYYHQQQEGYNFVEVGSDPREQRFPY